MQTSKNKMSTIRLLYISNVLIWFYFNYVISDDVFFFDRSLNERRHPNLLDRVRNSEFVCQFWKQNVYRLKLSPRLRWILVSTLNSIVFNCNCTIMIKAAALLDILLFIGFSRLPSTGLQQTPNRAGSMAHGQFGPVSFGTPSHGQNTSTYLPGYLLGGHNLSQMVKMVDCNFYCLTKVGRHVCFCLHVVAGYFCIYIAWKSLIDSIEWK